MNGIFVRCLLISLMMLVLVLPCGCRELLPPVLSPAKFEVSSLVIAPDEAAVGQSVTIAVSVENIGWTEGTYPLTMTINDIKTDTKIIKIAPQSSERVSFAVTRNKPGIYNVKINGLSGTFRLLKPAEFAMSNIVVSPTIAEVGQIVTVTVDTRNVGEIADVFSATLRIGDAEVETKDITIGPEATQTIRFTVTRTRVGSHAVEVAGLTSFLIVMESGDTLEGLLRSTWPEFSQELYQLPELREVDMEDSEAVEDIAYLALNPAHKEIFESMLNEGMTDQRKYCTPLQALLWIAYDKEFDEYDPLTGHSLEKLLREAWKNTATSQNYASDRWQNFDEVIERLNSPRLVSIYMVDNISYKKHYGMGHFQAKKTFEMKSGPCSWQAAFAYHCLAKNGYEYDDFDSYETNSACILAAYEGQSIRWDGPGHVTCLYKEEGTFYLINNGRIQGPFHAIEQAATRTWRNWDCYELRDINAVTTKKVKRMK